MTQQPAPFTFESTDYDAEMMAVVTSMAEELARTMCIAQALVEHDRVVDLTGLDRGVGLLCAKALDLPPEAGRTVRPHLLALLVQADSLTEVLRAVGEA